MYVFSKLAMMVWWLMAGPIPQNPARGYVVASGCTVASGNVLAESFEGTGYEHTWTEGAGTPNEDGSLPGTSPCSGLGSQALNIVKSSATEQWTRYDEGALTGSVIRYFRCYFYLTSESIGNTDITSILIGTDSTDPGGLAGSWAFTIAVFQSSGGVLQMAGYVPGPSLVGSAINISTATWYRIEGSYKDSTATTGLTWKLFDSSGAQVGSTQQGTSVGEDIQYWVIGTRNSDNAAAINYTVDGFGVSSTGFLGQ